jgi:O-antigen ligase
VTNVSEVVTTTRSSASEERSITAAFAERLAAPAVVALALVLVFDARLAALGALGVAAVAGGVLSLRRYELFVLFVLVTRVAIDRIASSAPVAPAEAVALVVVVAGIRWWWQAGRPMPRSPLVAPFGLFAAAAAASVAASNDPVVSGRELGRLVAVGVMLVVLDLLLQRSLRPGAVVATIFASGLVPLAVGLLEGVTGDGRRIAGFARVDGTFAHPNPFGIYLALLLVAGVALLPHVARRERFLLAVLLVPTGTCLLLTYTRGAWIAAVLGLLVVGALQSRRLLIGMLVAVVVAAVFVPSIGARFSDLERDRRLSGAAGNSLVWRFEHWGAALGDVIENPVSGVGLKMVQERSEGQKNVHNDFIRILVETGVIGFGAYLWLLARITKIALVALRRTRSGLPRGIAVASAGGAVVVLVASISANVITQVVLLWYFVALALVAWRVVDAPRDAADRVAA